MKTGKNDRYPDALVDCGPRDARDTVVEGPIAVFEVLSSSTAWIDQSLEMRDYDANPAIRIYGLLLQDEIRGLVYRRDAAGHLSPGNLTILERPTTTLDLPELDISIPMISIYDRFLA